MRVEELPPITLGMFRPINRSRQAEQDYNGLIRFFYGEAGREFAEGLEEGRFSLLDVPAFRDRIDSHFFKAFADAYHVPSFATPVSNYREAQRIAREVVRDCVFSAFPNYSDDLFRNEITLESTSPTDFFFYLAQPEGPIQDYERRRHFLLYNAGASIEAISGNGTLSLHLSDINRLFDKSLFEPHSGQVTTIYANHDPETNEVREIYLEKPQEPLINGVLRTHTLTLRKVPDVGLVQTRVRQKNSASATRKMMGKADQAGGVLNPRSVKDYMGFALIVLGDGDPSVSSEAKVNLLRNRSERLLRTYRSIVRIEPDDSVDGDRGQAAIRFKRDQVYTADSPDNPLEIMFFRDLDYLNQTFEVGSLDPQTGFYNGRSHRLFDLRRRYLVIPHVYPKEIFGIDAQEALIVRMHEVAEAIKDPTSEGIRVYGNVTY